MATDAPDRVEDPPVVEHWPGGLTWLAHPTEVMQRASHAIVAGGSVWLVDPVEATGIHEAIDSLGSVVGIVLLLDRHRRDAGRFAQRYDVAVHVPAPLGDAADRLGVPVEPLGSEVGETGFRIRPVLENRFWREVALIREATETALVPEALGTAAYYTAPGEPVGVHPALRLWPPRRQLAGIDPERLLVGHGPPVLEGAGPAMRDALAGARRRAPRAYWRILRSAVRA